MSVIFGRYHLNKSPLAAIDLEKMQSKLNHWNPDDIGVWQNECIGLGHLMLWNTPESLHEKLPYQSPQSGNIITADARIDNREDLFSKLNISNHSISDSYLILLAYDRYGRDCVSHLLGDFAFVIWDKHKQELFCARDQVGIKPFFYFLKKGIFIFSSEINGILANSAFEFRFNDDYFLNDFYQILNTKDMTAYQGILSLEGGHYLIVNQNHVEKKRYWDLEIKDNHQKKTDEEYLEEFEHLFTQATKARLRSSYDIAAQMSGGLDSTGVVAKTNELLKNSSTNLFAYSHVLSPKYISKIFPYEDESKWINLALHSLKLKNHQFLYAENRNYLDDIRKKNSIFGGPFVKTTVDMTMFTVEAASSKSRTLLSGFLGDEFASYHWPGFWREYLKNRNYIQVFNHLNKKYNKRTWLNFYRLIKLILKYEFQIKHKKNIVLPSPVKTMEGMLLKEKYFQEDKIKLGLSKVPPYTYDNKEYQYFRLNVASLDYRLIAESIVAQAYRMEMRYPLADVRLIEYAYNLPFSQKYRNLQSRFLFRRVLKKYLPEGFIKNDKIYIYTVPTLHAMYLNNYDAIMNCIENAISFNQLEYIDFEKVKDIYKKSQNIEKYPNLIHALSHNHLLIALLLFLEDNPKVIPPLEHFT